MDTITLFNGMVFVIVLSFIVIFCIDIKISYPKWIVYTINEPILRFTLYIVAYLLSLYNPILCLYFLIAVLFVHLDFINLMKVSKNINNV